jgi:uncharacterized protein (TIGR02449 family)
VRSCLSHSVLLVADNLIQALEKKVNDLIELSRELNRENRALKLRAAELQRERRELLERQRQASEHVETSLARLRSLDGSA